jgi:hypothetical protein
MMERHWKIAIVILTVFVVFGVLSIPALFRSVLGLRHAAVTAEQSRHLISQQPISTPTDTLVKAQLFWASPTSPTLEPSEIALPLSADPVQRAKQLIAALIAQAPTPEQRTLPADAALLQFYLLPDGTAVADFSETLGTETPSGILSEQLAVDSISHTLGASVGAVHRLKILIHGQESDTLAGHLDLTGFFPVESTDASVSPTNAPASSPATPETAGPASEAAPAPAAAKPSSP